MFSDICKGKFKFHPQRWSNVSEGAKELIRALLTVDQNVRLTATQALAHPWILAEDDLLLEKELTDNLEELRQFNASRKLKAGVHVVRTVNMFLRAINDKKKSSFQEGMAAKAKEMSAAAASNGAISASNSTVAGHASSSMTPLKGSSSGSGNGSAGTKGMNSPTQNQTNVLETPTRKRS
jgi:serine/threonine protein kinase